MRKTIKVSALALMVAASAVTTNATTLLESVSVNFTIYTADGTTTRGGDTVNLTTKSHFLSKDLITNLVGSYTAGDTLVKAYPVTNIAAYTTNLTSNYSTNVVITNISTFGGFTNVVLIGPAPYTLGVNSNILGTNGGSITFTTNSGGTNVSLGSNYVYYTNIAGPAGSYLSNYIGTNTTVTATTLTTDSGDYIVGTNYAFVINGVTTTNVGTNVLGTAYWAVYNTHTKVLSTNSALTTNSPFSLYTDHVYGLTNAAKLSGETILPDGIVKSGTTEEIRSLVVSNSAIVLKVSGYVQGKVVTVALSRTDLVPLHDYNWTASGSGYSVATTNIFLMDGSVTEAYFKTISE